MIPAVSAATGGSPNFTYMWVAAGSSGELYTSTSTSVATGSWTSRTSSFSTTNIRGVASNGASLYVAVGDSGKLATSPDGITWTQRTSSFSTTDINHIAYGGGYWVAVGASAKVAYSTDGITWTQVTTGISGNVHRVAWGNGVWLIANATGSLYSATDPTGTWTSRTSTVSTVADMLYFKGQSIWLLGNDTGTTGALASSTDGLTWTARTSAINITGSGSLTARFGANTTVAVAYVVSGSFVTDVESTANGTTYTDRTASGLDSFPIYAASDDAGLIVLNPMVTTSNGTSYTAQTSPSVNIQTLCHSSGTPSLR